MRLLVHSFGFDKDDNVEEEGDEDKDDGSENPNGKGGQSRRVGGGGRKSRVEHVHQNLLIVINFANSQDIKDLYCLNSHQQSCQEEATASGIGGRRNQETYFRHKNKETLLLKLSLFELQTFQNQ